MGLVLWCSKHQKYTKSWMSVSRIIAQLFGMILFHVGAIFFLQSYTTAQRGTCIYLWRHSCMLPLKIEKIVYNWNGRQVNCRRSRDAESRTPRPQWHSTQWGIKDRQIVKDAKSTKNKRETKSELLKFKRLESHHSQQRPTSRFFDGIKNVTHYTMLFSLWRILFTLHPP